MVFMAVKAIYKIKYNNSEQTRRRRIVGQQTGLVCRTEESSSSIKMRNI